MRPWWSVVFPVSPSQWSLISSSLLGGIFSTQHWLCDEHCTCFIWSAILEALWSAYYVFSADKEVVGPDYVLPPPCSLPCSILQINGDSGVDPKFMVKDDASRGDFHFKEGERKLISFGPTIWNSGPSLCDNIASTLSCTGSLGC